jgi:hypothetical protein
MNWSDPNWISAIGSLLAVIASLWIAFWSIKHAYKQSDHARYSSAMPVLVIGEADEILHPLYLDEDNPPLADLPLSTRYGKWTGDSRAVMMKNVGTGIAFNIVSVVYGTKSLDKHIEFKLGCLGVDHSWRCLYEPLYQVDGSLYVREHTEIGGYSFYASSASGDSFLENYGFRRESEPLDENSDSLVDGNCYSSDFRSFHKPSLCLARVVTTYHDIFKRKHASIFDVDLDNNWTMCAVLEDIPYDLYDLEKLKYPVLKLSLFNRFKNGK